MHSWAPLTISVSGCEFGVPPSRRSRCRPSACSAQRGECVDGLSRQADDSPLGKGSDRLMDHVARIVTVEKVDPLGVCRRFSHQNPLSRRKGDGSKEQGQALDFPNFRVNRTDLLSGLHADIESQRDVAAAGRGPDRVVQVRSAPEAEKRPSPRLDAQSHERPTQWP